MGGCRSSVTSAPAFFRPHFFFDFLGAAFDFGLEGAAAFVLEGALFCLPDFSLIMEANGDELSDVNRVI